MLLMPFFTCHSVYGFYETFNSEHGMVMSFIKFAVLATFGEAIGLRIRTGHYNHGVPGAFMSMLGVAFLNEIASDPSIKHTDEILNVLREFVIRSLNQTGKEGESRDGMDIAITRVDLKTGMLEFSGANNPLILIREGELAEYPPDKMPIGIHVKEEEPFTRHDITLREGDQLYLFSDGFSDQFGGPDQRKYMKKQLKEFLLKISHAVLAINTDTESLIICNGYKDEDYIELALLAQKMGKRIYIVVEKLNELKLIASISKRLKIRPNIGIRIKLASSGSGKWEDSGGDVSKFGLTSSELLEAVDFLEKNKLKDCLRLIHFHIGSQVNKIRRIKIALREASQFYVQLYKYGFHIDFVDIGGGLGVDYDGTRSSNSESSVNYSIQEYVNDSIFTFVDAANKNNIPHPNVITESGRSLTAHHSVLIFEVLETTSTPSWDDEEVVGADAHELVRDLYSLWETLNQTRMLAIEAKILWLSSLIMLFMV